MPKVSFRVDRFLVVFILCFYSIDLFSANEYNIIPYPKQLIPQNGSFTINSQTIVLCSIHQPEVLKLARQFTSQFKLVSGIELSLQEIENADTTNSILFQCTLNSENPEAYRLHISHRTIRIQANSPNGFFYGLQTFYQLLPAEIYGNKKSVGEKWSAPAVDIADAPRFPYRGLHLDVCRHFFPVEFIKKYIDAMAIHKLNYFHWHLTDDQGWRIEIKKYPRLTEVGSKRAETLEGYYFSRYPQRFDGKPYGGFYTQAEAREIVKYAADHFITVIPEIEMPGHAQAAIAAYPYLSCTRDATIKVATKWGVFKEVFCPRDTTFRFLEDVLTEIMDIFPSKYIHIGGDECPKDRWRTCPDCQALIKKQKLKNEDELQSYFIQRITTFLNSKGRRIIGWDEILDGGLTHDATIMSWRGTKGGIAAAKAGHDVIMTPGETCYFDKYQSNPLTEPVTIGGYLPLAKVYGYEPVPTELTDNESKYILGVQANVWTEYMPTSDNVEYMVFPRLAAMAEVQWSSKANRNWDLFRKRIIKEFDRYKQMNIKPCNALFEVYFQTNITDNHKLQLTLLCDHPDAQIYYEINGKTIIYNEPIILSETSTITAKALVNNKQPGKSITKMFQISKLAGLDYIKSVNNSWYEGGSTNALTDGVLGNTVAYTQWVGVAKGKDCEIAFDLKKPTMITRCSVGLLHATPLCVVLPAGMKILGSMDGNNYTLLAEKQIPASTSSVWEMIRPEVTFATTTLRFMKVALKSGGNCQSDNPDNKEESMMFMDEIGAW